MRRPAWWMLSAFLMSLALYGCQTTALDTHDLDWRGISGGDNDFEPRSHDPALAAPPSQPVESGTTPPQSAIWTPTWTEPQTGMQFIWVPGGEFEMGCGWWTGACDKDEKPVFSVELDGFWLGRFEVTQGEWKTLMGKNPSRFKKSDYHPVEKVSADDIDRFINKMNALGQGTFRLPTEAQWEYACRSGGMPEAYAGGNYYGAFAWSKDNGEQQTHAVGALTPNGLGFHDMTGNVWEWVEDRRRSYPKKPERNPLFDRSGVEQVYRGGSWVNGGRRLRCSFRRSQMPSIKGSHIGFRLARMP